MTEYSSGEIYFDCRKKELIANSICATIKRLAEMRDEMESLGIGTRGLDWDIQNYQAILKDLAEE